VKKDHVQTFDTLEEKKRYQNGKGYADSNEKKMRAEKVVGKKIRCKICEDAKGLLFH
jgi:hypothetical protein